MQVRLLPYSEVFVVLTLSVKEADTLAQALDAAAAWGMEREVTDVTNKMQDELIDAVGRAEALQKKRDNQ